MLCVANHTSLLQLKARCANIIYFSLQIGMTRLIASVNLTAFKKKVDRSYSLTIETPELSIEQLTAVDSLYQTNAYLVMDVNPIKSFDEIKDGLASELPKKPPQGKSQSQRLRNTLHVYRKQQGSGWEFDTFYKKHMEKIITHYQSKLED